MDTVKITIIYAIALIILGIGGYVSTGMVSITALIPTFFGIVVLILGILAKKENIRKHVLHVAMLLALIGIVATASAVPSLIPILSGEEVEKAPAIISKSIMAIMSLLYLLVGIKSFIDARKNK